MPIQAIAAGQMKLAMGRLEAALLQLYYDFDIWAWPITTIHDELIVECDERYVNEVEEVMATALDGCMVDEETHEHRFRVPIKSDGVALSRWKKD